MSNDQQDYFLRRAREERERARAAAEAASAEAHLELAKLYEQRVEDPSAGPGMPSQKPA